MVSYSIAVVGLAWLKKQKVGAGLVQGQGALTAESVKGRQRHAGVKHSASGAILPSLKSSCHHLLNSRP